ncbi:MAG TPA: OmpH family outer membrane protein [Burkholderiales bacterium]|nr:OmpH family outer membrane protein [Burkholderiales bacterium]
MEIKATVTRHKTQESGGRNRRFYFCLVPFALCLAVAADAAAQGVKVGYVNLARIERESTASQRALEVLKQEFEPRHQQVREMQQRIQAAREQFEKDRGQMPAAEAQAKGREIGDMMRQSDQRVVQISQEFELRRNELRARLIAQVKAAITAVAEAGKFDLVLQEAVFAGPAIDITDSVLKELAQRPQ